MAGPLGAGDAEITLEAGREEELLHPLQRGRAAPGELRNENAGLCDRDQQRFHVPE